MPGRSRLQTLAANRVRHASLEARVAEARNKRASRGLSGELVAVNQVTREVATRRDSRSVLGRSSSFL